MAKTDKGRSRVLNALDEFEVRVERVKKELEKKSKVREPTLEEEAQLAASFHEIRQRREKGITTHLQYKSNLREVERVLAGGSEGKDPDGDEGDDGEESSTVVEEAVIPRPYGVIPVTKSVRYRTASVFNITIPEVSAMEAVQDIDDVFSTETAQDEPKAFTLSDAAVKLLRHAGEDNTYVREVAEEGRLVVYTEEHEEDEKPLGSIMRAVKAAEARALRDAREEEAILAAQLEEERKKELQIVTADAGTLRKMVTELTDQLKRHKGVEDRLVLFKIAVRDKVREYRAVIRRYQQWEADGKIFDVRRLAAENRFLVQEREQLYKKVFGHRPERKIPPVTASWEGDEQQSTPLSEEIAGLQERLAQAEAREAKLKGDIAVERTKFSQRRARLAQKLERTRVVGFERLSQLLRALESQEAALMAFHDSSPEEDTVPSVVHLEHELLKLEGEIAEEKKGRMLETLGLQAVVTEKKTEVDVLQRTLDEVRKELDAVNRERLGLYAKLYTTQPSASAIESFSSQYLDPARITSLVDAIVSGHSDPSGGLIKKAVHSFADSMREVLGAVGGLCLYMRGEGQGALDGLVTISENGLLRFSQKMKGAMERMRQLERKGSDYSIDIDSPDHPLSVSILRRHVSFDGSDPRPKERLRGAFLNMFGESEADAPPDLNMDVDVYEGPEDELDLLRSVGHILTSPADGGPRSPGERSIGSPTNSPAGVFSCGTIRTVNTLLLPSPKGRPRELAPYPSIPNIPACESTFRFTTRERTALLRAVDQSMRDPSTTTTALLTPRSPKVRREPISPLALPSEAVGAGQKTRKASRPHDDDQWGSGDEHPVIPEGVSVGSASEHALDESDRKSGDKELPADEVRMITVALRAKLAGGDRVELSERERWVLSKVVASKFSPSHDMAPSPALSPEITLASPRRRMRDVAVQVEDAVLLRFLAGMADDPAMSESSVSHARLHKVLRSSSLTSRVAAEWSMSSTPDKEREAFPVPKGHVAEPKPGGAQPETREEKMRRVARGDAQWTRVREEALTSLVTSISDIATAKREEMRWRGMFPNMTFEEFIAFLWNAVDVRCRKILPDTRYYRISMRSAEGRAVQHILRDFWMKCRKRIEIEMMGHEDLRAHIVEAARSHSRATGAQRLQSTSLLLIKRKGSRAAEKEKEREKEATRKPEPADLQKVQSTKINRFRKEVRKRAATEVMSLKRRAIVTAAFGGACALLRDVAQQLHEREREREKEEEGEEERVEPEDDDPAELTTVNNWISALITEEEAEERVRAAVREVEQKYLELRCEKEEAARPAQMQELQVEAVQSKYKRAFEEVVDVHHTLVTALHEELRLAQTRMQLMTEKDHTEGVGGPREETRRRLEMIQRMAAQKIQEERDRVRHAQELISRLKKAKAEAQTNAQHEIQRSLEHQIRDLLRDHRREIADMKHSFDGVVRDINDERQSLIKEIRSLRAERSALQDQHEALEQKVAAEREAWAREREHLRGELCDIRREEGEYFKGQVKDKTSKLEGERARVAELQRQVEVSRRCHEDTKGKLAEAVARQEELQGRITSLQQQLLETMAKQAEDTNRLRESTRKDHAEKHKLLAASNRAKDDTIVRVTEMVHKLSRDNEALRKELQEGARLHSARQDEEEYWKSREGLFAVRYLRLHKKLFDFLQKLRDSFSLTLVVDEPPGADWAVKHYASSSPRSREVTFVREELVKVQAVLQECIMRDDRLLVAAFDALCDYISGARYRCTNSPPRHHENREEGKAKRETTVCYPGLLEDQPPVVPTGKHILYLNAFLPTTASRPGSPPRGQLVHRSPPFGGQAGDEGDISQVCIIGKRRDRRSRPTSAAAAMTRPAWPFANDPDLMKPLQRPASANQVKGVKCLEPTRNPLTTIFDIPPVMQTAKGGRRPVLLSQLLSRRQERKQKPQAATSSDEDGSPPPPLLRYVPQEDIPPPMLPPPSHPTPPRSRTPRECCPHDDVPNPLVVSSSQ